MILGVARRLCAASCRPRLTYSVSVGAWAGRWEGGWQVMRKADMLRKNQLEHVRAERAILARAHNPYVVKLYFAFQSRHHLYLVLEFVNGGDLCTLLSAVGALDERVARTYIAELVAAVGYLHHTLGVVHRDLKP